MYSNTNSWLILPAAGVFFDAFRKWTWTPVEGVMTYDDAYINTNNVMNIATGKFTAPQDGVYQFHFVSQNYDAGHNTRVNLRKNNDNIWLATSISGTSSDWHAYVGSYMSTIVQLVKGDQIYVYKSMDPNLYDTQTERFTHFTGQLLL